MISDDALDTMVAFGLFAFIFGVWIFKSLRSSAKVKRLKTSGVKATGRILKVEDAGRGSTRRRVVNITLEVLDQARPLQITVSATVSIVAFPKVGDYVTVFYNPDDPTDATLLLDDYDANPVTNSETADQENREIVDRLKALTALHERGALTDEEYSQQKTKISKEL